jgi:hypothetical protein
MLPTTLLAASDGRRRSDRYIAVKTSRLLDRRLYGRYCRTVCAPTKRLGIAAEASAILRVGSSVANNDRLCELNATPRDEQERGRGRLLLSTKSLQQRVPSEAIEPHYINMYLQSQLLHRIWSSQSDGRGSRLTANEALEVGRAVFAPILAESKSRP